MSVYAYTPRKMQSVDRERVFVARRQLLEELLETLRIQRQADTLQHWMILGPRGIGKSHLLTLFNDKVREQTALLGHWIPVLMNEEEQGVFSLHTLFVRILVKLAESLSALEQEEAAGEVSLFVEHLRDGEEKPRQILDTAVAFLKDFGHEKGRRLVVLLENTDDLLTRCLPNERDVRHLRQILSAESFMLLIAASPTFFERIRNPSATLYNMFRLRRLELLTYGEATELLGKWAELDGKKDLAGFFDRPDYRLRVLYHLT
ncbi:AAA family ATPase, partial [Thermodesulfobacteriota bacterium]